LTSADEGLRLSAVRTEHLPAGLKFAAPWNHDPKLLELLERRVGRFERFYAPLPPWIAPTGRPWSGPEAKSAHRAEMEMLCSHCARWDVGLTLLANCQGFPVDVPRLVEEVRWTAQRAPRVRVVFSDLPVAERAAPLLSGIEIGVSCLAEVRTAMQAEIWRRSCGASIVSVARAINRDLRALHAIKNTGMGVSVVLSDLCLLDCPWHIHHFKGEMVGETGHQCIQTMFYPCHPSAAAIRSQFPFLLAPKEPLPGHMRYYGDLDAEMKLPGRSHETHDIIRVFDLYWEATSLHHPFLPYAEPPEAWDVLAACNRDCVHCDYCASNLTVDPPVTAQQPSPVEQPSEKPAGADGWVFERGDGAMVSIRCSQPTGHRSIRMVAGLDVGYNEATGASTAELIALVNAVADVLEAQGYDPRAGRVNVHLPRAPWPGGFVLRP